MKTTSYEAFLRAMGRRIQHIRKSRGISQELAGKMAGLDRVMVGYIEQGRRAPSLRSMFDLAIVLDVPIEAFLCDMPIEGGQRQDMRAQ